MNKSRRNILLSVVGIGSVGGCSRIGSWGVESAADVHLTNDDDRTYLATVVVTSSEIDGENEQEKPVLGGETVIFKDMVPHSDHDHTFRIEISLDRESAYSGVHSVTIQQESLGFRITEPNEIDATFGEDDSET